MALIDIEVKINLESEVEKLLGMRKRMITDSRIRQGKILCNRH